MGKENIKVYEYSCKGVFIKDYDSISNFSENNNTSSNIFSQGNRIINNFYPLKSGNIATLSKVGVKAILEYVNYRESRFVGRSKRLSEAKQNKANKGKVIFYDLDMDKIAEFKSVFQARLLTGFSESCFIVEFGKLKKNRKGIYIEVLKS